MLEDEVTYVTQLVCGQCQLNERLEKAGKIGYKLRCHFRHGCRIMPAHLLDKNQSYDN